MKSKLLFTIALFYIYSITTAASHGTAYLPPSATIAYNSPICNSSVSVPVIFTGTTGGVFMASPAGLSINAANGMINPGSSSPGTYVVAYTIAASGPDPNFTTTTTVTIYSNVTPLFFFGSHTLCAGAESPVLPLVSANGVTGTWNPSVISTSVTGTYVFTPDPGQCANSTTEIFIINPTPVATISPSMTICGGLTTSIVISGSANATVGYTFNGGPTQTILLNASGTANITYNFSTSSAICLQSITSMSGCTALISACSTITVVPSPSGTDRAVSICDSDTTPINLNAVLTDEQPGGTWTRIAGTGGTFDAANATFIAAPGTTTSYFMYSNSNPLCGNDTSIVTVNIISQLNFPDSFPDIMSCSSFTLYPPVAGNYYTEPNGAGQLLPVGSELYNSQIVYVFAQSGSCTAEASFYVTILALESPVFTPLQDICANSSAFALPSVSTNGISGTWSPSAVDGSVIGTTTYTFTPDPAFCAAQVTMTINVIPCGGIALNAFFDANNNGVEDNNEYKFPLGQFHYEVNADGVQHHAMASNGMYTIYDGNSSNSYNISYTINSPYDAFYSVSTLSYSNVSPDITTSVYNFPVTVSQAYTDLQITLVPLSDPRPGMPYYNRIIFSNQGNTAVNNGSIEFVKDQAVTLISASLPGTVSTTAGFHYDFINLGPFETRYLDVALQVPTIPTVAIGQLLTNSATIQNPDSSAADNSLLTQMIVGSYDPNDITEGHGNEIVFSDFTSDDYLYYTIRFENTGNAEAIDVRITDDLDGRLDESSIQLVSASDAYTIERTGNHLEFRFDDIMLPPCIAESTIGKGYVTFKIKPQPGYAIGDIIPSSAAIYFDFNPPVLTNTFETEFVAQLAVSEFESNMFSIYPNPANDKVTVSANGANPIETVVIYDVLGKKMLSHGGNSASETLNIESLQSGLYFLEITTADHLKSTRKLLVK